MKCLVTGAAGLIGGYLIEHLLEQGQEVIALDVHSSPLLDSLRGQVSFVTTDMSNHKELLRLLEELMPDAIFHLAAQSLPQKSWEEPEATFDVNVGATVHLLKALTETDLQPTVLVACSSGEYAASTTGQAIQETDRLDPSSPYAVSKMVVDQFARVYGERFDLKVIRVRPFFLVGPRKRYDVCSDFAEGVLAVARHEAHVMRVGNLDVVRDIMDVRDGVAALWLLAQKGGAGEVYNICTGEGVRIGAILDVFKTLAGVDPEVQQDTARLRAIEEMVKVGDASKLKALGWAPRYTLDQTLEDIYRYWETNS